MLLAFSLTTGLLIATIYRLARHRSILPRASGSDRLVAWLKILGITVFVAFFVWIALILLEKFPD